MNPLLEQFLQEARENLAYVDQNLESIEGLLGITELTGLAIRNCNSLVSLEGLDSITTASVHLELAENSLITTLEPLSGVTSTGNLHIRWNDTLTGLDVTLGRSFQGLIDEIRIYDRVLSADEIATLASSALQLYLPLDERDGLTARDRSLHQHLCHLVNGPTWTPSQGVTGGALSFDGMDDRIAVDYAGILSGASRTCSAWIKTDRVNGDIMARAWPRGGNADMGMNMPLMNSSGIRTKFSGIMIFPTDSVGTEANIMPMYANATQDNIMPSKKGTILTIEN